MPATPSQLRAPRIVDHTLDFGEGVTVRFVYDRNKLTDAWMKEWERLEEQADTPQLNAMLDDLITSWDVSNEDGTPFPKTADNIGFLFALPDKAWIFEELIKASVPSRAEGNASPEPSNTSDSSATTQATATPPNGQPPSPSPSVSVSPSPT